MDENIIQMIPKEAAEEYIHLIKITRYKQGFTDGLLSGGLISLGIGTGLLTLAAGGLVGYLFYDYCKNGGLSYGSESTERKLRQSEKI